MSENTRQIGAGHRGSRLPRAIFILLICLTLLLVTAGLAGGWFFQQINEKYSKLVVRTAEDLNDVHDIAFHSGISYAHLLELPPDSEPDKRAQLLQTITAERAANDQVFDDLRRTVADSQVRSGLEEVVAKRQVFKKAAEAFIGESAKSGALEVEAAPSRRLLLAFEEYQTSCDKLGDLIQANSLQTSAQVSAQIGRLRLLFLGLAILPVAAAFFLVVLTLWLFWGTPMEADLRDAN